MKVVELDVINCDLQEKIIKLSEARQEALKKYNIRDYSTLSHLIDALCATRDYINAIISLWQQIK